ncbi:replicative DNA helicase [Candidatus Cytomitobacter indipagum]|uniref:Replicative DNA helicase n=1 Tax=Candidatus Cytomitobacter indipagum TaxID=2601575 RepID=A0A5C0UDP5_9PROT|nr:replicative DNA helicase [Candidatus Cytomitobacter indipagum]QEK38175.1 replicative DNA helicase [Candidatus Cytomitobacter indipagum]
MTDESENKIVCVLPSAIEAEKALLGALLHENLLFENVSEFLLPQHFFDPLHQKIFEHISYVINKGQLANPITIWPFFLKDESIKDYGGEDYLKNLESYIISLSHTEDYGKQIFDRYLRRQLILIGDQIKSEAYDMKLKQNALDQIEGAENNLFSLATLGIQKSNVKFGQALNLAVKQAEIAFRSTDHVVGVATGLHGLDRALGGFHKSDLIILAARPSMGKTALATNIAFRAAMRKQKVAFFSLEMSSEQLALRILGSETNIPSDRIRRGAIQEHEMHMLTKTSQKLLDIPLFIDDTPGLTVSGLRTRARRLHRQEKLDLIIIDYLQLMHAGTNQDNRTQELSFITRSLKSLAKELSLPVIALSQLSRAVEQRDDKRPQLADLRESGTIEQDADVVMFIFREAYYESRKKPSEGSDKMEAWQARMEKIHNLAEIMIAKQRHGPIKNVQVGFEDAMTKFYDLDIA